MSAARAAQRRDLGGHGPTFGPSWSPWCSVGGSEKEGRARGRGVGVGSFAANSHHLNEVGRALLSIKKHRVMDLVARVNPLLSHPVHQQPPCAGSTASRKVFQHIVMKRRLETSRVVDRAGHKIDRSTDLSDFTLLSWVGLTSTCNNAFLLFFPSFYYLSILYDFYGDLALSAFLFLCYHYSLNAESCPTLVYP